MNANLPDWVMAKLRECPGAGNGVNRWLFGSAGCLKAFLPKDQAVEMLREAAVGCGRPIRPGEIERAYDRAEAVKLSSDRQEKFAGRDARKCATVDGCGTMGEYDWWEASPIRIDWPVEESRATWVLGQLFKPDETVCLIKRELFEARLCPMARLPRNVAEASFVVPNPMKPEGGTTDDGKPSQRAKNGVDHRRYVVADFDQDSPEQHLWRIEYLQTLAKLVAIVWTGGKGWHGWFHVEHKPVDALHRFLNLVCELGGDPAAWQPHQVFRLPDGTRYPKKDAPDTGTIRQRLLYLDPVL
jgi:hypothetical protein